MADFTATSRVPTRPLSYANKSMAYRKELLVDYTNGMIYVIDENGVEHSISQQVYETIIENGDLGGDIVVTIPDGSGGTTNVTIEQALTDIINSIDVIQENITNIQKLVDAFIDESGDITVDASTIIQDATHRFLTDTQISKLQEKVSIIEKIITINPADVSGSSAPYQCTKAVAGVNPSYPRPIIDIAYTDNNYSNNEAEEDAYYCMHRCQINNKDEAVFTFKEKPQTAFRVLFQIKVPGIS